MKRFAAVLLFVIAAGCASNVADSSRTPEAVARWYGEGRSAVRFIGYQGSDEVRHHFIARVMDTWTFFQIRKEKLRLSDERIFPSASSAQLYYYLVNPSRDFEKVEPSKNG